MATKPKGSQPIDWMKRKEGFSVRLAGQDGIGLAVLKTTFRGRMLHTLNGCSKLYIIHKDLQRNMCFHLRDACWRDGEVTEGRSKIAVTDDAAAWDPEWLCFGLDVVVNWRSHLFVTDRRCGLSEGPLRSLLRRPDVTEQAVGAWITAFHESILTETLEVLSSEAAKEVFGRIAERYFPTAPDLRMKYAGIEFARIFQGGDCSPR